ncbi:uncharacterized protein LOC144347282 [Saccoglossus kowalevskii]
MGYMVDAEGIHTTRKKVEAINNAPKPQNLHQLKSFLGILNYYGKFIPNLAMLAHPLKHLLEKNVPWKWTDECDASFRSLKDELSSAHVLVHYSEKLPLKLACDASPYDVGAVISHVIKWRRKTHRFCI